MAVEVAAAAESANDDQATTHALEQPQSISSENNPIGNETQNPWELVEMSINRPPVESNPLLLRASELFLNQQHYSTAYSMLEEIDPSWLERDEKHYFALNRARYALLTSDTTRAQSLLAQVPRNASLSRENHSRLLQLDIAIAVQQRDLERAVMARIELDALLFGHAQLLNQQGILNTLTRESQLFAGGQATTRLSVLQGWQALASLNRNRRLDDVEISSWQQQFPQHPAQAGALAASQQAGVVSSQQIALLLPTTSKLGRAAEAFKAGFDAAVAKGGDFDRSRVYDIGSETDLVGLYYQSAVNDGADFIIGPLGRAGAHALLTHLSRTANPGVSTLLLGELSSESAGTPNLWGLSLSPEQDAEAIAERTISQGMRSAIVLQKNNDWGRRLGTAFTLAFEAKGGLVVGTQQFQPEASDHSLEVKNILDISSSETRHTKLQNLLGTKLEFSVRRRNDVDFMFLAGNTRDARRVIPLAKFYRAHDLPVYATSSAFNGRFNKLTDEDLKGLYFSDLPWLLNRQVESQNREKARIKSEKETAEATAQALAQGLPAPLPGVEAIAENTQTLTRESPFEELPYRSATLNRLYALGYTAYETIPQLSYLQSDVWYQFDTQTMSLDMDENRNLRHGVAWGKYRADGIRLSP